MTNIYDSIELGPITGSAGPTYIDFHTLGAQTSDYEARIIAMGGAVDAAGKGIPASGSIDLQLAKFTINQRALVYATARTFHVEDYKSAVDADDTNSFNRAIAAAQALNAPTILDLSAGDFVLSSAIAPTLTGFQGIYMRGAGADVCRIYQNADADGFRATINDYGPNYGRGGSFNVSGVAIFMNAAASNTRTALSVSATSFGTGCPLILDDIVIASPNAGASTPSYWATGISASAISNVGYISRVSIYCINGLGIGLSLAGTSNSFTTAVFADRITVIGTNTGVVLGDYMQGIQMDNLFTVNTPNAIVSNVSQGHTASGGAVSDNAYVFTRCYLYGKTYFHALEGAVASFQMKFVGCYFDGNVNGAGPAIDKHVSFVNVPQVTLADCTFNGAAPPASMPIIGLYVQNQSYSTVVTGCAFGKYGSPGDGSTSVAMLLDTNTTQVTVSDNVFDFNTKTIIDHGTSNLFLNNRVTRGEAGNDGFFGYGVPASLPPIALPFLGAGIAPSDVKVNGTDSVAAAWTVTNPTPTPSSGSFGANATAAVHAKKIGRTVYVNIKVSIPNVGSAGGNIQVPLPYPCVVSSGFSGREGSTTGRGLNGITVDGGSILYITDYAGNFAAPLNGATLVVSGVYESAA